MVATTREREPRRRVYPHGFGPEAYRTTVRRIERPEDIIEPLQAVISKGITLQVEGHMLGPEQSGALLERTEQLKQVRGLIGQRLPKIQRIAPQRVATVRWVAARFKELDLVKGIPSRRLYPAAYTFMDQLVLAEITPLEYLKPTPKEKILREDALLNALAHIDLSIYPDSVASQLRNLPRMTVFGVVVAPNHPVEKGFEFNYDFAVLRLALFDILEPLKHPESEEVFKNWLLIQFSRTEADAQATIALLKVLADVAAWMDPPTQRGLWQPPVSIPGREPEILLQPFYSLTNGVDYVRQQIRRTSPHHVIVQALDRIKDLIRLRCQVYTNVYRTSLVTAGLGALTPAPENFAQLATLVTQNGSADPKSTAKTWVGLAESTGLTSIEPLITRLKTQPELQLALIAEAKRAGFIDSVEPMREAIEALRTRPWVDAAQKQFDQIIRKDITHLEIYAYPGSFAPFTKGHKAVVVATNAYMDSLPEEEGEKLTQRKLLLIPTTDTSNIPAYTKDVATLGPQAARLGSMLLHLHDFDPDRVLITTDSQPDPPAVRSAQGRAIATINKLSAKIYADLERAGRTPEFEIVIRLVMGADELAWEGERPNLRLAPRANQPNKVRRPGGVLVVRHDYVLPVLQNHQALLQETGIETTIIPNTPPYSSSGVRQEIAETGRTRSVDAAAEPLVIRYWNPEAIDRRQREGVIYQDCSIGEVCQRLVNNLGVL